MWENETKGCDLVILVHDLDRNDLKNLEKNLNDLINKSKVKNKFVCIPIEEIEGWFLADPYGIKNVFNLKRVPKIKGNPESIDSPKERLEDFVYQCSDKSKMYLNTQHNDLLSANLCLNKISSKSKSFNDFKENINAYEY